MPKQKSLNKTHVKSGQQGREKDEQREAIELLTSSVERIELFVRILRFICVSEFEKRGGDESAQHQNTKRVETGAVVDIIETSACKCTVVIHAH